MNNGIFKLNLADWQKAIVMAVFVGFGLPLAAAIQTPGFNVFTTNWSVVLTLAINGAIIGGATYIIKNFLSDTSGRFLGRIG